ncbi:MAG: glutathione S-transferase family protein [Pseudomonadota bacterium]
MQIIGRLNSINVQKVIWCLAELGKVEGTDYERVDAGLEHGINNTADYLQMNPTGLVPTLVDGDFVLWESNAIVRYLAASMGAGSGLMPQDLKVRADSDRWMDWTLATLWPPVRTAFIGMNRTPEDKRNMTAIKAAYDDATQQIRGLDNVLLEQPYCAGQTFTMGDIPTGLTVYRWMILAKRFPEQMGTPPAYQGVAQWLERLGSRPAFKSVPAQ